MASYFFDCEFIEHATGIELLSIGIVAEDGRTFYAENTAVDYRLADDWVKENVIKKLEIVKNRVHYGQQYLKSSCWSHSHTGHICEDPEQITIIGNYTDIKEGIIHFIKDEFQYMGNNTHPIKELDDWSDIEKPIFYAYYADYDWVVFCKIFGRMIDLPDTFPMYCQDLKQELDRKVSKLENEDLIDLHVDLLPDVYIETGATPSFDIKLDLIKSLPNYPKQENEHNALDDAQWNFKLYKFIEQL